MKIPIVASMAVMLALMLAACAGGRAIPDWQLNASSSADSMTAAYMAGNDRVEGAEFARARAAMASSGQVVQVARVELLRCAMRVASLVLDECSGFEKLRADSDAASRAYADYLAGRAPLADAALLPPAQRSVLSAAPQALAAAVASIDDPLSQLVAAAVLLRSGRADPQVIAIAVDTASAQGWRRPLLAWLGVQAMRARQGGDAAEEQRLRRRIDLVRSSVPAG